ncbi:MAG: LamG domain-containing protein [Sedimentisphaerales bacterium]|nr:LamG domain-containing protein [Sedimentisphaerales bacterium]
MYRKVFCLFSFLCVLILTNSTQAQLIGYWKFDESSGTVAADSAGGDNDGTLSENVEWQPDFGKKAGAVLFDGESTAHVEFPTTGMSATSATIGLWAYLSEPQPSQTRYFFGHTTQPSYSNRIQLYMDGGNRELDLGLGDSHTRQTNIAVLETQVWYHVALTWDNGSYFVYLNGEEVANGTYSGLGILHPFMWIGNDGNPVSEGTEGFGGMLDEVRVYNIALNAEQVQAIMRGEPLPLASRPNPKDGDIILETWVNISWAPGDFAVTHDVYIGDDFDDVNNGAESTFVGNQVDTFFVAGFPGFAIPDGLVPGTTYYWRIDEVNEAEPNSPWKGKIWSFSVAPKTAYEPEPADGAESVAMDVTLSWTPGYGAKLHTVYVGDSFNDVNNATGGQVQGSTDYSPGTLKIAKTYYWRVDEFDVFETHKGKVWSFTTEGGVSNPSPVKGAVDITQTPVLTWTPGLGATHEIYFGTDAGALERKSSGSLGSESFEPGQLEWNTTYYWRVDEANNTNSDSPWTGPLWSFTTANFLIIDDMEGYNDLDPADPASNRIFNAWIDGYDDPTNGSLVGYDNPPFAEQTIVHGGSQSMPFSYDNSVGKSEATLTLTSNRNWTVNGVDTLTIWFRGSAGNAAENLYVALNGNAVVNHDNPEAALRMVWTQWNIDLQAFADKGVNLTNVNSITLGLSSVTGGSGMMYFDDVRLYSLAP